MSAPVDSFCRPDYSGGSIVNLMSSIMAARGGPPSAYPPTPLIDAASIANARNVMLMVIDGLGYNYLTRRARHSALRHHLVGKLTSVFPSTTATAITTFLTGLAPQQHGLTGWFTYFREWDTVATVLLFQSRNRGGVSLSELGVDPATMFDHKPFFDRIGTASYTVVPSRIAYSPFNLAHSGTANIRPYDSLREFFEVSANTLRESEEPKYVYAYWPEFDQLAHEHGVGSERVAKHLRHFDSAFQDFLRNLRGSGTTLIVTADHGFIDSGPDHLVEVGQHPGLEEALMHPLCGEPRAGYCYVKPDKAADFQVYVSETLGRQSILHDSSELLTQGYFGLGKPHPRLAERIGHFTLIMRDAYIVKDWLPQERRHMLIGTHGGLSADEMYVPLILVET